MSQLAARLAELKQAIAEAEQRHGRRPGEVTLLAASKGQSPAHIEAAAACGQRLFGESYLQEAEAKMAALGERDLEWHFIGPIQTNKTRAIARGFAWVHSVDRLKVAQRLNDQRPADLPALAVCLQVNVSEETRKSGMAPRELAPLAEQVAALPRLALRGLMAIPAPTPDVAAQARAFARVRAALEDLNRRGHRLDTLSMGMTADMEAAIAEGATIVRVGTGLFGPRR